MNKILDDIKPLTSARRASRVRVYEPDEEKPEKPSRRRSTTPPSLPPEVFEREERGRPVAFLWVVAGIAVVGMFFVMSTFFGSAKVTIIPKTVPIEIAKTNFTANKNAAEDALGFEFMSLTEEVTTTAQGTSSGSVERKASGTVVLYNEYSSTAQPLLANTRLETKDGKLYRTDTATSIPGYTKTSSGINPGYVSVKVHADEAGPKYNIDPTDFVVVGFKGTSRDGKIYARAKTPISGGFIGNLYELKPADKEKAMAEIEKSLRSKLEGRAEKEIPEGYVAFKTSYIWKLDQVPTFESDKEVITATQKGVLIVPIFKRNVLVNTIAKTGLSTYKDESVDSPDVGGLSFDYRNKDFDPRSASSLDFSLGGKVTIVYGVDQDSLKKDLSGVSRSHFQEIMTGHEEIESASVVLRPLWKRSFPKEADKIHIVIDNGAEETP